MKKIYILFVFIAISSLNAFSIKKVTLKLEKASETKLNIISSESTSFILENTISSFTVTETITPEGIFNELFIENYGKNYNSIGKPHLPALTKLCEIPYGSTPVIEIISYDKEVINLNTKVNTYKLAPSQPSVSKGIDPENIVFRYDKDYYQTDAFNKNRMIKVDFKGTMRGVGIGRITISPFKYNPVKNQLIIYNNLVFKITFKNADLKHTNELKAKFYSPYFESTFRQLINYTPNTNKDAITTYPITYVIVSDPVFQTDLQSFIEWKTKKGFKVIEAYTDVIGTTTTAIHNYLENLYLTENPAPTFVVFVGDIAQIPAYSGTTGSHVTDLYYCTFDGSGDIIPDMYYGRFSAESSVELQTIIEKTLMHEQYTWPDDTFLDNCVMIAGVDASYGPTHGNGQIYYGINEYFNTTNGYTNIYTYLYGASTHPYQVMSSADAGASADIQSKISAGVGFANYTAHCSSSGWSDPGFSTTDVAAMTNQDMYPVMIGNCCLSNKFDDSDCFGETLLHTSKKGAVAYIGASNNSLWDEDFYWSTGINTLSITATNAELHDYTNTGAAMYDGIWHTHGEPEADWYITTGEMIHTGNMSVENSTSTQNTYYWEIYHLMGDPSIMAYLSIPPAINVSYINPIVFGITSLTVNTEQYAYVAISKNGILLDAQYTGSNTSVTLTFPAFTDTLPADIVVTKQNRQPYIGTLNIINANTSDDAGVTNIDNPVNNYDCPQLVQPRFTIQNLGTNNLTSLTTGYILDGGTAVTQAWTGNLAQYETDTVTFPAINLPAGNHTFEAFSTNPNGNPDEYTANDTMVFSFVVNDYVTIADFTADEQLFCDPPATVTFTNNSVYASSYYWDFGDGTTGTDQNPVHDFTSYGNYTVMLIADNGVCGNDTLVMTDFVSIDPGNPCENIMPASSTVTDTACVGILYDSGGETGNYSDNENGVYVIAPIGATNITLNFISFDVEANTWLGGCYDQLDIYDGPSVSSPLIGSYCNDNPPTVITGTGNAITLNFISDGSVTKQGFEIHWACNTSVQINDANTKKDISIYPNPVSDILYVNAFNNNIEKIEINDILGKIIYHKTGISESVEINTAGISPGIYTINIYTDKSVISKKIIVK